MKFCASYQLQCWQTVLCFEFRFEYEKFKPLLEYFVAHLEFCVTDEKVSEGYNKYIKRIKNFKRAGQGHKGQEIQNQIKDWDSYNNGTICININSTVYKTGGCYLNWECSKHYGIYRKIKLRFVRIVNFVTFVAIVEPI